MTGKETATEGQTGARTAADSRSQRVLNKNFVLLLQAQFVSRMGSAVYVVALVFWLKQATGSATVIGLLVMAGMLPGVILGPLGGAFADYFSRKAIIISGDLINGAILLAVVPVMLEAPGHTDLIVSLLFLVSVISGAVGAFFQPAISAALPDLVPARRIDAANSLMQSAMMSSSLVGQFAGGVLFRMVGAPLLMFMDGLSYIFSGLSELFMVIPQNRTREKAAWQIEIRRFRANVYEGFDFVRRQTGLRVLFIVASIVSFLTAPISVWFPFYIESTLKAAPDWYGYMMASMSAGMIMGSILAGVVTVPSARRSAVVIANLVLFSSSIGAFAICTDAVMAASIMGFIGICSGVQGVLITSILQRNIPPDMRGRVFGLLGTINTTLIPVSMGLAGIAADLLHKNMSLLFLISGVSSVLMAPFLIFNRAFHEFLTSEVSHEQPMTLST